MHCLTKQPSIASDLFISALFEIEADLVAEITTVILEVELGQLESVDGREKLTSAIRDHVNEYLEEDLGYVSWNNRSIYNQLQRNLSCITDYINK